MGEEKETRDRVRLSVLICITQLLLGGSAIGRVQVGKKEPGDKRQAEADISLVLPPQVVRGEPEGLL